MTNEIAVLAEQAPAELGQCLWVLRLEEGGRSFQARCQLNSGHRSRPESLYDHIWFDSAPPHVRVEWDESAGGAFRADLEEVAAAQVLTEAGSQTQVVDAELVDDEVSVSTGRADLFVHLCAWPDGHDVQASNITDDVLPVLVQFHDREHREHQDELTHRHLINATEVRR